MEPAGPPLVLVVDGNPESREQVRKWLEGSYEVVTADDGFDAMTCVLARRPDLVILDLMMRRVTGYELLAAFQRSLECVPRLVLSDRFDQPGNRLAPLVLGATDVLGKPVGRIELLHKVETLLRLRGPAPQLMDPAEAEALFASTSKSRLLERPQFAERVARACSLGERLGLSSSLLTIAADSAESLDLLLGEVDESLRFEDAALRVSRRRAVLLLVATDCVDASVVVERLCKRVECAAERVVRMQIQPRPAERVRIDYDWHQLFRSDEGAASGDTETSA
ncbi:MAG: response regulator [bacterium]|nr:response regulator [bacterium]